MTHYKSDDAYAHPELTDIISPDEARPGLPMALAGWWC